ncbi:MAG: right-handed parallel beta-helix repeat-containing protein [Candidatus Aenigmarchaeota archaeon]|nr:right-handed parallel beta-helix repeat-containing protein [Candidatus Aenigmarchaeota archaeon]
MAYKRYIRKNGKVYGPYIYKSIRDENGNVRNIYVKKANKAQARNIGFTLQKIAKDNLVIVLAILLVSGSAFFLMQPTGMIIKEELTINTLAMKWAVNESAERTITLSGPPKSISASGVILGNGSVRIFAVKNGDRYLVYERTPIAVGSPFTGMAIADRDIGEQPDEQAGAEESQTPEEPPTTPEARELTETATEDAGKKEEPTREPSLEVTPSQEDQTDAEAQTSPAEEFPSESPTPPEDELNSQHPEETPIDEGLKQPEQEPLLKRPEPFHEENLTGGPEEPAGMIPKVTVPRPDENATMPEGDITVPNTNETRNVTESPVNITIPPENITNATMPEDNVTNISEPPANITLPEENITEENITKITNLTEPIPPAPTAYTVTFTDVCVETCTVAGFNETFTLIVEVEPGAQLFIESVTYAVAVPIEINEPPELIANIPDIRLYENGTTKIDLASYFSDPDGDELDYFAIQPYNITILTYGSKADIIPDSGFTGTASTFFYADDGINATPSNLVEITVAENVTTPQLQFNATNVTIEQTIQSEAVVGRPVMWTRHITLPNFTANLSVTLPRDADNITVTRTENQTARIVPADNMTVKASKVISVGDGEYEEEIQKKEEEIKVVMFEKEGEPAKPRYVRPSRLVVDSSLNETGLTIEEPVIELELTYYTDPPTKTEQNVSNITKQIVVSSETGYTDIKASSTLPTESPSTWVHLFWLVNGTKTEVPFNLTDTNNNTLPDLIEWTVPHTSNQTYEIEIIPVIKALHLDQDKALIDDVYEPVREQDDVWTYPIPDGNYLRVTFEQELDSTKDITIYARANRTSEIEVYTLNGTYVTAFTGIQQEAWHQVLLTNLSANESHDTFYLRILGYVEFDYIVDPLITEEQVATDANFIDVVAETGDMHYSHLNISDTPPYDNLVAYWSFDGDKENSLGFTAYDLTEYDNDGVGKNDAFVSSTTYFGSPCVFGDCAQFDGADDFINVSNPSPLNDMPNFSASVWFKFLNGTDGAVGSSSNQMYMYFFNKVGGIGRNGGWQFYVWVDAITSSNWHYLKAIVDYDTQDAVSQQAIGTTMYRDTWYMGTISFNGTWISMYLDGQEINYHLTNSKSAQGTRYSDSDNSLLIGNEAVLNRDMNGSLDEMMIFNTTLTDAQVLALYHNQSSRFKTTGKQQFDNQTYLNISSGNNKVNVTTYFESGWDSTVNLSVGYYDGSWSSTDPQTLTSGVNSTFDISASATNLTLNYTLIAGNSTSNPFYTPIMWNVSFHAYGEATTGPQITLYAPENTTYNSMFIDLNVSSSDTVDKWWYQYDGNGTNITFTPNTTFGAGGGDGARHIVVWANDSGGVESTAGENFTVDTTPPNVFLVAPANNTVNDTDLTPDFVFNTTDNRTGTMDCFLWMDNGTVYAYGRNSATANATSTKLAANVTLTVGNYWWWVNCSDAAGNMNTSVKRNMSVRNDPPSVFLVAPANNTLNTTDSTPDFVFNVTDAMSATLDCFLWLDNGTVAAYGRNSATPKDTATKIDANTTLENEDYWWWINCSDGPNSNVSETRNISIRDMGVPQLTIANPENNTYYTNVIEFEIVGDEALSFCLFTLSDWAVNYTMAQSDATHFTYTNESMNYKVHTAEFWCNDTSNNVNSTENVTFTLEFSIVNNWNCSSANDFDTVNCWTRNSVPVAGETVIFNGSGTGDCNVTNNTMPQNITVFRVDPGYTGTISFHPLFAKGDWTGNNDGTQLWNVTSDINISGGTGSKMLIWGDVRHIDFRGKVGNITDEGHGQEWRSLTGDITIGPSTILLGTDMGFQCLEGPGAESLNSGAHGGWNGASYGAKVYGNASAPTSLGSGSGYSCASGSGYKGASAIKLHADAGDITVNGGIDMAGSSGAFLYPRGAGGSIWLLGDVITGAGWLNASGGGNTNDDGAGGGRMRLEYGSSMSLTGVIKVSGGRGSQKSNYGCSGTLTFTNNTWLGDWTLTGNIGLLGGDFGDGETINVLGDFNTNGFNITIYGDCFGNNGNYKHSICFNTTDEGKGVWINASGNITIDAVTEVIGYKGGFPTLVGPGAHLNHGANHGGIGGGNTRPLYGSFMQPRSLGSGGGTATTGVLGGSALKLQSDSGTVRVDGSIDMYAIGGSPYARGAGGSIWLSGHNITGTGVLNTSVGKSTNDDGGGGGRIALTGDIVEFNGTILNMGGGGSGVDGSGGTVFINSSVSTITSMTILATGYDGGVIMFNDSLLKLSGTYYATGTNSDGDIYVNFTKCTSRFTGTFDPAYIYNGPDLCAGINVWNCTANYRFDNASCWTASAVPVHGDEVFFNATGNGDCNITNNTMPQNLTSFTVEQGYTGTIDFQPLFAKGDWTGNGDGTQLWNVTYDINVSGGSGSSLKTWGDYLHNLFFPAATGNITDEGHGQEWRSLRGDVIIGRLSFLDGIGLGFEEETGPGAQSFVSGETIWAGATHGGFGGRNQKDPYGNATAPTSLGSGGDNHNPQVTRGGSSIKLHAYDLLQVDGTIDMGAPDATLDEDSTGAGGSIWLNADNITGTGHLFAEGGGHCPSCALLAGGGGRVRLEYGSAMSFTGNISIIGGVVSYANYFGTAGTLTFTGNTWPGDWNVNGSFGLLGGDYGEGATLNVLGDFVLDDNQEIFIYGDCFGNNGSSKAYVCYNTTDDGRGVWLNASGDITIGSGSRIDGEGFGFPEYFIGPGSCGANKGSAHGGAGSSCTNTYGNEHAPLSLGSGGQYDSTRDRNAGGSAIKLQADSGTITMDGEIDMRAFCVGSAGCPSPGSIWLQAAAISGSGILNASGDDVGVAAYNAGGGRIALTSTGTVDFSGVINNKGGSYGAGSAGYGSGGTVYINASNEIVSSMNISVISGNGSVGTGYGGNITFVDHYFNLSGTYNATGKDGDGVITINYTDCGSVFDDATFDPAATYNYECLQTRCAALDKANTVYTQTANIIPDWDEDPCINISADNITYDGNGFWISNASQAGTGIYSDRINSTIKNSNVTMNDSASGTGIELVRSNQSSVSDSILNSQYHGLYLSLTNNVTVDNITALYNVYGITLSSSFNSTLTNSNMSGNDYNFYVSGTANRHFDHVIGYTNKVDNSYNIHYNYSISDHTFDTTKAPDAGTVVCAACDNVTYEDLDLSHHNHDGILFFNTNNSRIDNIVASYNDNGISLSSGSNNTITGVTATSNNNGISLSSSSNNTVSGSTIWNCSSGGSYACVYIDESDGNVFSGNNISRSSGYGIWIRSSGSGDHSSHNVFRDAEMTDTDGTPVFLDDASGSANLNNTFLNYTYGSETVDSASQLLRKWYYRAYVNDTGGSDVPDASVQAFNSTSAMIAGLTTNSTGWTGIGHLIDYTNSGGASQYYSNYSINASATGYLNGSNERNISVSLNMLEDNIELTPATAPVITAINVFPDNPLTIQPLNCSVKAYDEHFTTLYANFTWYQNSSGTVAAETDYDVTEVAFANDTTTYTSVNVSESDENHTKDVEWTCQVTVYNAAGVYGADNGTETINNTPPDQVTLTTPADGSNTTDVSPMFSWAAGNDDDGDSLNYTINITCVKGCSDDNREGVLIDGSVNCSDGYCNYTPSQDFGYFGDDNFYYNWSVRAFDGEHYGAWSDTWNFTLYTNVTITLYVNVVAFGSIFPGLSNDTTDDSPVPFKIRNDGNCFIDINISAEDLLWDTQPSPSDFYKYKIDNVTGEQGSLNWSSDNTTKTWTPIPLVNGSAISYLNYSDASDEAEIEIHIEVPSGEGAGDKSSTIWFTAGYNEGGT